MAYFDGAKWRSAPQNDGLQDIALSWLEVCDDQVAWKLADYT